MCESLQRLSLQVLQAEQIDAAAPDLHRHLRCHGEFSEVFVYGRDQVNPLKVGNITVFA